MAAIAAMGVAVSACAPEKVAEKDWGIYEVNGVRSGFTYASIDTRKIQEDEFSNPGMLFVEAGEDLWDVAEGEAGKACSDCHSDVENMKGVALKYPKYVEKTGKLQNVEQRINQCRTEKMKAKAWKYESDDLLSMTSFIFYQSKGMSVTMDIEGPAKSFWEDGKKFYEARRGQLDMACSHCHVNHSGEMIRANRLTEGMSNGFPTYRLKWQKVGSLHRRFRGCNKNVRAKPYGYGSEEYNSLELYVRSRGIGLPVETPAVRN
jgi:sulfur-oxidizing protein SoxA